MQITVNLPRNIAMSFRTILATSYCSALAQINAAIMRYKTRATLYALDDHLLKDIGVSRSDIDRIARLPNASLHSLSIKDH